MFATIGALDVLMRQMNDLKDKRLEYCDDGNIIARLQARIDEEIARAKKQVSKLEQQLGSLKRSIDRCGNVSNQNRPIVEAAIKQVVKAGERRVSIALRHSHTEITDFCLVAAC